MTRDEWFDQCVELEDTMPDPTTDLLRERRRQMWDRLAEIENYLVNDGPEPRADWKLTVPDATEEEKVELRARALEWFIGEMEGLKRDFAAIDAAEAARKKEDGT